MKKKIITIFILSFLFIIISCKSSSKYTDQKEPVYIHLSDEIIKKTAKELKHEKRIDLIGHGGQLMYNVKKLNISFCCDKTVDIQEARQLILYCAQKFLFNINSDEEIRPYLQIFPFQVKDINIDISFDEFESISNQNIDFVSLHYGQIIYDINDKAEVLKTVHEETYEEALKIIEKDNPNRSNLSDTQQPINATTNILRAGLSLMVPRQTKTSKLMTSEWIKYLDQDERNEIFQICHRDGNTLARNALITLPESYKNRIKIVGIATDRYISHTLAKSIIQYVAKSNFVTNVNKETINRGADSIEHSNSDKSEDKYIHNMQHPVYAPFLEHCIQNFINKD